MLRLFVYKTVSHWFIEFPIENSANYFQLHFPYFSRQSRFSLDSNEFIDEGKNLNWILTLCQDSWPEEMSQSDIFVREICCFRFIVKRQIRRKIGIRRITKSQNIDCPNIFFFLLSSFDFSYCLKYTQTFLSFFVTQLYYVL